MTRLSVSHLIALLVLVPAPGAAQSNIGEDGWNSPRALELIERARARRLLPRQDTALRNYTAEAEGFVYFYLDRNESEERTLVKVDQVALELRWSPPDRTSQRIVGLRDVSRLPNRMHYHLDHLTVVQNGFGDVIRMGDGDEVRDIPHPAAPGSDSIYEFRMGDSLTIRLPNASEPIRVYELEVRPLRRDRPALVGSIYVDRGSADLVRMTFTFTPASYVDRRLDYINVSLDNGLWEGKYWLPNEQTLQIRRQIPELDFAAGAVIQGRMRISNYTFNDTLPPEAFLARGVSAVPEAQREAFEFDRGIYDDLNDEGLSPPPDLAVIRRRAAELLGTRRLSGLPRIRFGLGSASSALRYNRWEGIAAGAGIVYAPGPPWRLDFAGGFAFGPERPWASIEVARDAAPRGGTSLRVYYRSTRDMGIARALPGAINTLSSAFLGRDYTDPYFTTGARLRMTRDLSERMVGGLDLVAERHSGASLTQSAALLNDSEEFRDVRAIDAGDVSSAVFTLRRPMPDPRAEDWSAELGLEIGAFDGNYYARPTFDVEVRRSSADLSRDVTVAASGGFVTAHAPSQKLFVLGGRGTLPGYAFRSFAGRRYAHVDVQASLAVVQPWVRVRAVGAAGIAAGLPSFDPATDAATPAWQTWNVSGSDGVRASVGAGVSLLWDLLRIDALRGVNGGDWRYEVSFHPDLLDIS